MKSGPRSASGSAIRPLCRLLPRPKVRMGWRLAVPRPILTAVLRMLKSTTSHARKANWSPVAAIVNQRQSIFTKMYFCRQPGSCHSAGRRSMSNSHDLAGRVSIAIWLNYCAILTTQGHCIRAAPDFRNPPIFWYTQSFAIIRIGI